MYSKIKNLKEIAKLGKAQGVKGNVFCYLKDYKFISEKFPNYVFISIVGNFVPFFVDSFKIKGEDNCILKFVDIDNKEKAAKQLSNKSIFIEEEKISQFFEAIKVENELGFDFEEYTLIDENEIVVGKITDTYATNGSFLLNVIYKDKEVLIPLHQDLIIKVNEKEKTLKLNLPEGILEI